jgi:integrase
MPTLCLRARASGPGRAPTRAIKRGSPGGDERGKLWPQDQCYFREELARYAKKAKIDHVFPHALRHTFATRYLQGGGDIYVLSKILGHASVTMTERVYAHVQKDDLVQRSKHVQLDLVTVGGYSAQTSPSEALERTA